MLDDSGWLLALVRELHPASLKPEARPEGWSDFSDEQRERLKRAYRAMLAAAPPLVCEPESSIDRQQRRGVFANIVDEALLAYGDFMMDDDYDADAALVRIMTRMKERRALYHEVEAPPLPGPPSRQLGSTGNITK